MHTSLADPHAFETTRLSERISIVAIGGVGAFAIISTPGVLHALAAMADLSVAQAARIAATELLGMLAATLLFGRLLMRPGRRQFLAIAFVTLAAGDVASIWLARSDALLIMRFVCGLSEGFALAAMGAAAARVSRPDRLFAIYMASNLVAVTLFFTALPRILAAGGLSGMFLTLSLLGLIGLMAVPHFPDLPAEARHRAIEVVARKRADRGAVLGLVASLVFCCGIGVVWPLIGEIGRTLSLSPAEVESALGVAPIGGIAAGLISAVFDRRFGRRLPLAAGGAALLATMLLISGGALPFALLTTSFMFWWVFVTTFFMGTIAAADPMGHVSQLIPASQQGGLALGPLLASGLMVEGSFRYAVMVGALVCLVGLMLAISASAARRG